MRKILGLDFKDDIKKIALLAPLAGITDLPFRQICKEQGADFVFTEMVSAKGIYFSDKKTDKLLEISGNEKPAGIQLFSREPDILGLAIKKIGDRGQACVDINMGCPVPKIVRNAEGSALLRDLDLACELVRAAVVSTNLPVSVKLRIGFDREHIVAVELAKGLESAGASMLTVHGRTREDFYSGEVNYDVIRDVKQSVKIPVIANGNIFSGVDAVKMIERTGADGVMLAQGVLGNPWLFGEVKQAFLGVEERELVANRPGLEVRRNGLLKQLSMTADYKGERVAIKEIRKHVGWYFKGYKGRGRLLDRVNHIEAMGELIAEISSFGKN